MNRWFWWGIVVVAGGMTLWFGGVGLLRMWEYWRLEGVATARVVKWEVVERGPSKYNLSATYTYTVGAHEYDGKTIFVKPVYLNRFAAAGDIPEWSGHPWQAYYVKKSPQISSLQKVIPWKDLIRALMSGAVLFYFVALRRLT